MLVAASLFGCAVFSYLYLWIVAPRHVARGRRAAAARLSAARGGAARRRAARRSASRVARSHATAARCRRWRSRSSCWPCGFGVEAFAHRDSVADGIRLRCDRLVDRLARRVRCRGRRRPRGVRDRAPLRAAMLDRDAAHVFDNARIFWHYVVAQNVAGSGPRARLPAAGGLPCSTSTTLRIARARSCGPCTSRSIYGVTALACARGTRRVVPWVIGLATLARRRVRRRDHRCARIRGATISRTGWRRRSRASRSLAIVWEAIAGAFVARVVRMIARHASARVRLGDRDRARPARGRVPA